MQEIKLNEPFTLEGKMVKIVECEPTNGQWSYPYSQPKKERWFKCLKPENYKHSLKKMKPYRFDFIPTDATVSIQYMAGAFPNDFEEVTPDFICQHSGEGFMNGDKCYMCDPVELSDIEEDVIVVEPNSSEVNDYIAYFHTTKDALAWQEAKFGKKEEGIRWSIYTFKTIEDRSDYIFENANINLADSLAIMKLCMKCAEDGTIKPYKEIAVEYILNKGGK